MPEKLNNNLARPEGDRNQKEFLETVQRFFSVLYPLDSTFQSSRRETPPFVKFIFSNSGGQSGFDTVSYPLS
jgi:hypothetical protein